MEGQLSNPEFMAMYEKAARAMCAWFDPVNRTARVRYGKSTINYYLQHEDGSWTCYDTRTIYM